MTPTQSAMDSTPMTRAASGARSSVSQSPTVRNGQR